MKKDDLLELLRRLPPADWLRRRETFYEKAFGPLRQPAVFHFEDDGDPHVDVYVIASTESRPHLTLVTGGLADRAQPGPRDGDPVAKLFPRGIELVTYAEANETQLTRLALILRELSSLPLLFGVTLAPGVLVRGSRPIFPERRFTTRRSPPT